MQHYIWGVDFLSTHYLHTITLTEHRTKVRPLCQMRMQITHNHNNHARLRRLEVTLRIFSGIILTVFQVGMRHVEASRRAQNIVSYGPIV